MQQIVTRYLLQLSFFLSSFGAFAQVGNEKWSIADRLAPERIPGVSEASQPRIGFTDPAQQKTTSLAAD